MAEDDVQQIGLDASGTFTTLAEFGRRLATLRSDLERTAATFQRAGTDMGGINVTMVDTIEGLGKLTVRMHEAEDGAVTFSHALVANAEANRKAAEAQRYSNDVFGQLKAINESNILSLEKFRDTLDVIGPKTQRQGAFLASVTSTLRNQRDAWIELNRVIELNEARSSNPGRVGAIRQPRDEDVISGRKPFTTQDERSAFMSQENTGRLEAEKERIAREDITRNQRVAEASVVAWAKAAEETAAIQAKTEADTERNRVYLARRFQAEIKRTRREDAEEEKRTQQEQAQVFRDNADLRQRFENEILRTQQEDAAEVERIQREQAEIFRENADLRKRFEDEILRTEEEDAAEVERLQREQAQVFRDNADLRKRFEAELVRIQREDEERLQQDRRTREEQDAARQRLLAQRGADLRERAEEHAARYAIQQEERLQAVRRQDAQTTGPALVGNAFAGRAPSVAEVQQIRGLVRGITDEIERGTITAFRVRDIFHQVQQGTIGDLTGVEARVAEVSRRVIGTAQGMGRAWGDQAQEMIQQNRQLGREFQLMGENGQNAFNRFEISWRSASRLIIAQTIHTAVRQIFQEIREGMDTAAQFEIRLSEIRTISQTAQLSFNQWAGAVRGLSDEFGAPILETAEGLYETISNQVSRGAEATDFMRKAMEFARVGVASTADSVNLLSSALNAYHLSVAETDRVAAILFKTVDLGRVRVSELANSFGRVASLASPLGVSLEEVATAIATLTIQGIKYNEAYTLINNVLTKLIRPTKEMKELLDQWGFSTGQAAISALGFEGVLRKLQDTANKGVGEVSELFNEIRGQRGALALTGAFDTFQRDLAQITNSMEQYKEAQRIAAESTGREWVTELNKVKNYFEDTGSSALHWIVDWTRETDSAGNTTRGFSDTIKSLVADVKALLEAWAAYRVVMLAAAGAQALSNLQMRAGAVAAGLQAAGVQNVTAAEVRRDLIRNTLNPTLAFGSLADAATSIGQVALPLTAMALIFGYFNSKATEAEERARAMYDNIDTVARKSADEQTKDLQERLDRELQMHRAALDAQSKIYLQNESNNRSSIERIIKFQVDNAKYADKVLKDLFDVQVKEQNDRLEDLNRQMTAAQNVMKQAEEQIFRMKEELQHGKFDREVGLLPGDQRIKAIQDQIKKLQDDAMNLLQAPAKNPIELQDNYKKAQEELKEVQRLQNEMQQTRQTEGQKEEDLRRRILELEEKHAGRVKERSAQQDITDTRNLLSAQQHRRGGARVAGLRQELGGERQEATDIRSSEQDRRDQEELENLKKKLAAQDAIKTALGDQGQFAKDVEAATARTIKILEDFEVKRAQAMEDRLKKEQELERTRLEAMKTAFQDIAKFKLPTKSDGTLDIADQGALKKSLEEFDSKVNELQKAGVSDPHVLFEIAQQRARMESEATAQIWKNESDARANEYAKRKQNLVELQEDVKKQRIDATQALERNVAAAEEAAGTIQQIVQSTGRAQLFERIGNVLGVEGKNPRVTEAVDTFAESIERLRTNPASRENAEAARESLRQLIYEGTLNSSTTFTPYGQERSAEDVVVKDLGLGKKITLADVQIQMQEYINGIIKANGVIKEAGIKQTQLNVATKQFEDWTAALNPAQQATLNFTDRVNNEVTALKALINETTRVGQTMAALETKIKQVTMGPQPAGTSPPVVLPIGVIGPPTHWQGGPIYREYGGWASRGTDIVHAMLTPGEFVVNAMASQKNRGLLEAINAGIEPILLPRMQTPANMGDQSTHTYHISMPITIQGGNNPQYDAQVLGKAIGRELSKGTITFDRSRRG